MFNAYKKGKQLVAISTSREKYLKSIKNKCFVNL